MARRASRPRLLVASLAVTAVLTATGLAARSAWRASDDARRAAERALLVARADGLARAGIAHALSHLRALARDQHWSACSGGVGSPLPDGADHPLPDQRWAYRMRVVDGDPATAYDDTGAGLPLEHAMFPNAPTTHSDAYVLGIPSLYRGNPGVARADDPILADYPAGESAEYDVAGAAITASGRGRPISGWIGNSRLPEGPAGHVSGTFEDWGDTYQLKILDCASMVDVNMDSAGLVPLLDRLGEEIDWFFRRRFTRDGRETERSPGELASMGYRYPGLALVSRTPLGAWLVGARDAQPGHRFRTKADLAAALAAFHGTAPVRVGELTLPAAVVAREDLAKLTDFVTCHAWRDRTVLEPGSLMTNELFAAADPSRPDREARAPINMNTASTPVLAAWLRGIAYHRYEQRDLARGDSTSTRVDFEQKFGPTSLRRVAFAFRRMVHFAPIQAWLGLLEVFAGEGVYEHQAGMAAQNEPLRAAFLMELDRAGLDAYDKDAWVAMANPNAMLTKHNPEAVCRRLVDKYDLAAWTTELCVSSGGYYEIESRGVVTRNGGRIAAARSVRSVYQVFDFVYHTTQRDFERNRLRTGPARDERELALEAGGWWGVTSLPESRNGALEYVEAAPGVPMDPHAHGYAALYDGSLVPAATRRPLGPRDFGASFGGRPDRGGAPSATELDATSPARYHRAPARFASARAVASEDGPQLRVAVPEAERPLRYDRVTGGGAPALARFHAGSDGFPLGLYTDALRRRALAFDAHGATDERGAIELWVQPRFDTAVTCEGWLTWRDADGRAIEIYREGAIVHVRFDRGLTVNFTLSYDTRLAPEGWAGGSWHHVYVDWDQCGRLFVDGHPANANGREPDPARTPDAASPAVRHMPFGARYRYRPTGSGESLWIGGVPNGSAPDSIAFANATIDGVRVTGRPLLGPERTSLEIGTDVPDRFPSGADDRAVPAVYWQDISAYFSGFDRDIELGTVLWNTSDPAGADLDLMLRLGEDPAEDVPTG